MGRGSGGDKLQPSSPASIRIEDTNAREGDPGLSAVWLSARNGSAPTLSVARQRDLLGPLPSDHALARMILAGDDNRWKMKMAGGEPGHSRR